MRLKILEALACGQTVLSTPLGATGFPAGEEGALSRAEPEHFASRLVELLEDPPPPGSNAAARRLAMPFDWRRLVAAVWATGRFHVAFCQGQTVVLYRGPEPSVPCPSWDALRAGAATPAPAEAAAPPER